jgi:nucleotide-binding universal stress UspA family protein
MPELRPYQRILALIHFDALDGHTAEKALLLARMNRAQLDFLHVIEPDGAMDGGYPNGDPRATARSLEAASLRRLDFMTARIGAGEASCHAIYAPLRQGFRRHIREWQPDLVISGVHHDCLRGSHDVLILAPARRPRRGKWVASLMGLLGVQAGAAGI